MIGILYRGSRHGTGWFSRARLVAGLASLAMLAIALIGWVGLGVGWLEPAIASWFGFSLLPLVGLIVMQATTRLQESLTMRFGGRPVAVEGGEK